LQALSLMKPANMMSLVGSSSSPRRTSTCSKRLSCECFFRAPGGTTPNQPTLAHRLTIKGPQDCLKNLQENLLSSWAKYTRLTSMRASKESLLILTRRCPSGSSSTRSYLTPDLMPTRIELDLW
jgi:hypothetical protein